MCVSVQSCLYLWGCSQVKGRIWEHGWLYMGKHASRHGCICGLRGRSRRCECPAGQPKEEAGGRMGRLHRGEEGEQGNRKTYRRNPSNGLPSTRLRLLIPEAFPLDFTSLVCHCKRKRKRRRQILETRTQIDRHTCCMYVMSRNPWREERDRESPRQASSHPHLQGWVSC